MLQTKIKILIEEYIIKIYHKKILIKETYIKDDET